MLISRTRLISVLLVSFLLGAVSTAVYDSVALDSRAGKRRGHSSRGMVVELSRELNLAPEQKERLGQILEEGRERIVALSRSMKPKYRQIKLETREQIRAILSAEQVERFNEMMQKWDEQRRKRSDRRQERHSRRGREPGG